MSIVPLSFDRALCLGATPMMFADGRGRPPDEPSEGNENRQQEAQRRCRLCPHMIACREFAIANDERHGVWGATTPQDRRQIRSAMRRAKAS